MGKMEKAINNCPPIIDIGKNIVVSPGIRKPYRFKLDELVFESMNPNDLASLGD